MEFLTKRGYREVNLFDTDLDISKLNLWGHLTDPLVRHTKGVSEYLSLNPDIDYTNPTIGKMLVSGMFDTHTYTIHMMLGPLVKYPIKWIPLDTTIKKFNPYPVESEILTGDDLTNLYFEEQKLEFRVNINDRRNFATEKEKQIREYVNGLKKIYVEEYKTLVRNVLEADSILYHSTLTEYYNKYSN